MMGKSVIFTTVFLVFMVGYINGQYPNIADEYKETGVKLINTGLQALNTAARTMEEAGNGVVRMVPGPAGRGFLSQSRTNSARFEHVDKAACRKGSSTMRPPTTIASG